ncbi:MAG: sugar-binding transcriptional regulator [Anaerolineales bacterium]|nr:sugar-binding transcriptional regulator [Anaerolineales bacterium]
MTEPDLHERLAQIASLYYEEELTQNEIAQRLGISRVKVYRLLKQARDEQVVTILIDWPIKRDARLERALVHTFGLQDALVLQSTAGDGNAGLHQLGQLAARFLEQHLQDGSTLSVCLGRSTFETINAIRPGFRARVKVAPALGSMPFAMQEPDSGALARRLAQKLGGEVYDLSAPVMADSVEAAAVLRSQRDIKRALEAAESAGMALVGIGNLDPAQSGYVKGGFMTPDELRLLAAAGAVGDIAGRIITADGQLHANRYDDRIIGIGFEQIKKIPCTIAVAMGPEKTHAINGALHTGIVKVLCTDDRTASAVLDMKK